MGRGFSIAAPHNRFAGQQRPNAAAKRSCWYLLAGTFLLLPGRVAPATGALVQTPAWQPWPQCSRRGTGANFPVLSTVGRSNYSKVVRMARFPGCTLAPPSWAGSSPVRWYTFRLLLMGGTRNPDLNHASWFMGHAYWTIFWGRYAWPTTCRVHESRMTRCQSGNGAQGFR